MTDKSKLVQLIKKTAQDLPDVPARSHGAKPATPPQSGQFGGGTSTGHGTTSTFDPPQRGGHGGSSSSWSGGGSSTAIMTMQHALQDLAADVSKQINLSQVTSQDPREQEEAKARDMFSTFITKNYMRNTTVPGVEYDPDPNVRRMQDKMKSQDDPTRMSVVMDTMNRVGKEKSESFVDGNWGPRTNAAIRDAFAFATGLFNMIDDINHLVPPEKQIHTSAYNKESLQNLGGMATVDNSLTPEQKSEAAPLVTQHVRAIKSLYDDVKNKFLQHPTYRQFIERDRSYKTYSPTAITKDQIDLLKNYFKNGIQITIPGVVKTVAQIENLISPEAFKTWMNNAMPTAVQEGKVTPAMVISKIEESLGHVASPAEPQQGLLAQNSPSEPGN